MERQPENRNFHLIFGIFELKKIRELVNRELDNPRISAPWLYNNHPQGIVDEPVFDWKVSEKAQIDPKKRSRTAHFDPKLFEENRES